ncbi:MAG: Spy/CpxP family protein refolding chaperone [Myxococcales bacterium]|nr:Spy/CpxP family protein refolding chaperone [Myxococcales bacterium]
MTRWIAALSLPLTLLFVACDSEPVDERSGEAQIAAADEAADAGEAGHFAHRGHKGPPGARLCAMVECSDAQASAVAELFTKNRPEKGDHRPDFAAMSGDHAALADAFRAGTLSADDLAKHRASLAAAMPAPERRGDLLVGLHGILTPEQRALVADKIAERGPGFLGGGKHGKHGGHGGHDKLGKKGEHGDHAKGPRFGDHEGAEHEGPRAGKMIGKLCAKVECTDEQRSALEAKATELHAGAPDHEAMKAKRDAAQRALADAFRGDAFSAADADAFAGGFKEMHEARGPGMDAMILELQSVLTPEQRGVLADKIAERGLFGLMGKGGKHGKHGKRGGKGKRAEHEGAADDAPCAGDCDGPCDHG